MSSATLSSTMSSKSTGTDIPRQAKDLTGQSFGRWGVLAYSHSDKGCWWFCKCQCGTERPVKASALLRGSSSSCGCVHGERPVNDEALWRRVFNGYRQNAKQRNITFDLDQNEVVELIQRDCHYCKAPPSNAVHSGRGPTKLLYNGIDRLNNQLGYITGNVVPCCKVCNYAKRDMSVDQFLCWVHQIARFTEEPAFSFEQLSPRDVERHPVINDVLNLYELD